jgi:hypothetical protein
MGARTRIENSEASAVRAGERVFERGVHKERSRFDDSRAV